MPKWNQVLNFPLEALNATKFTKEELIKSQSMIIVSLFDRETYTEAKMDGKLKILEENRFLGSFQIPLTAVIMSTDRLEFNFKLNRPLALPTYRVLGDDIVFLEDALLEEGKLRANE